MKSDKVELGSVELKAKVLEADAVAVCRIAWTEAYAALSRRAREVEFLNTYFFRLLRYTLKQGS